MSVLEWLKLPEVKNIHDLDDPATTLLHSKIYKKKPFLRNLYTEYYNEFKNSIPGQIENKCLVELGSGGGFIKEVIPNVITSDIMKVPDINLTFSALQMPFKDNTVDAFFLMNAFHHIENIKPFLDEVNRCLKVGGKMVMVDEANTPWSRFIFQSFHHEMFDPSEGWSFEKVGPVSSANGALAWIVFYRDRLKFEKWFPALKIVMLKPHTPFRYLISGGVSMRQLLPSFTYPIIKGIETILSPLNRYIGMFLTVEIEKVCHTGALTAYPSEKDAGTPQL